MKATAFEVVYGTPLGPVDPAEVTSLVLYDVQSDYSDGMDAYSEEYASMLMARGYGDTAINHLAWHTVTTLCGRDASSVTVSWE